ncbi:MAG: SPOR domain-containing protein [Gammaproteobacteria bacterium]|nr:SPOR domain-containing protein [Gammaproteobacteria bacterium]
MKQRQSGNIVIGLIVGLVVGLGVALGIAVYVTKVPIPFMTKTQRGGPEQDEEEARKNRNRDPNSPLAGKPGASRPAVATPPATPAPSTNSEGPLIAPTTPVPVVVAPPAQPQRTPRTAPAPVEATPAQPANDPIGQFANARPSIAGDAAAPAPAPAASNDPFIYFVQAGAFRSSTDAEAQRARLSLMGVDARVTEREQAGRTVYRVRSGPFNRKDDADRLKQRLDGGGMEAALVRVQR